MVVIRKVVLIRKETELKEHQEQGNISSKCRVLPGKHASAYKLGLQFSAQHVVFSCVQTSKQLLQKKKNEKQEGQLNCSKLGLITCGQRHRRTEWFTKRFSDDPEVWMIYTDDQTGLNWKCHSLVWVWVIPVLHVDSHEATNRRSWSLLRVHTFALTTKRLLLFGGGNWKRLAQELELCKKAGIKQFWPVEGHELGVEGADSWRPRWSQSFCRLGRFLFEKKRKKTHKATWKLLFLLIVNFTFC